MTSVLFDSDECVPRVVEWDGGNRKPATRWRNAVMVKRTVNYLINLIAFNKKRNLTTFCQEENNHDLNDLNDTLDDLSHFVYNLVNVSVGCCIREVIKSYYLVKFLEITPDYQKDAYIMVEVHKPKDKHNTVSKPHLLDPARP